ncbi:MAG TPA: T9SS type A sorting domain-containing protein, partial [Chitinophagaceae bacterium]
AKDVMNIALGENFQRITIIKMYDLAGKLIKQIPVNGKSNLVFSTDKVLPGIYLLKMQGDKVLTEKVLIQ